MGTPTLEELYAKGAAYKAYLDQRITWIPKSPREPLPIADMDDAWRYNASRWMERRATLYAFYYGFGEISCNSAPVWEEVIGEDSGRPVLSGRRFSEFDLMGEQTRDDFDRWQRERDADPVGWLRTTALYRALVDGLPTGRKLDQLAERARHWSTCPARAKRRAECQCRASCDRKPAPCLLCQHQHCGGCPECSPLVPD